MIIIGTIELSFTLRDGTFFCPNCRQQRPYKQKKKRQFLTVYFIPLIPLQAVGEFIQCQQCRQQFEPAAASLTEEDYQAARRRAALESIRRVLVLFLATEDTVTDREMLAVEDFLEQSRLQEVTLEQMHAETAWVRHAGMDSLEFIRQVAAILTPEDKELLVRHAFLVATADGQLSPPRQTLLRNLPDVLGIPESRFRELIVLAVERS
jgi:tellurite resistance protein